MTAKVRCIAWTKLPAIEGTYGGCFNCGPRPDTFAPDMRIGVGFGYAALTKDGNEVWSENMQADYQDCMTGAEAEKKAARDPNHDWRIVLHGPMSGRTYQRHAKGLWVLVEQDQGFA